MGAVLVACQTKAVLPENFSDTNDVADIYPDYRDITVPFNIAPLNVMVKGEGELYAASIKGADGQEIIVNADEDGKLLFDSLAWRKLLSDNKGKDLEVRLFTCKDGSWMRHPAYKISVANEAIDPYLSYRLIEPSYEIYRQLGIYQRNLENFDEQPIYENNDVYDDENNHCINCHNYQNYSTDRMLFHVRAKHGGTVFVDGDKVEKMDMKTDSTLANAVYPSWHPTKPWLVFSSNLTGQAFHMINDEKIEVVDYGSDLIFYDAANGTMSNILKTDNKLENFPCWAPDGKRVFYCLADVSAFDTIPAKDTDRRSDYILTHYNTFRYNLMSIPFDETTMKFGEPQVEMDCVAAGKSVSVPRVSPDGRYVLFTLGDYGQFHIWHRSSDLYVKDLTTGEIRPLTNTNSPDIDSYHTWSSNGRWIVFSSRRDDGSYTRPYIAYFDKDGKDYKAFLLPQEDPEYNMLRMKSYNVPELTKNRVKISQDEFRDVIYDDDTMQKVSYEER